ALARMVCAHMGQPASTVAALLRKFALGSLLRRLPGVDAARGHLPGRPTDHVPVLADHQDGLSIEEREDAHALSTAHDPVDRGASVGQLHEILPQRKPAILVNRRRGHRLPGDLRKPVHRVRSSKNSRVWRAAFSDAFRAACSRTRSSGVSMSYHTGRYATR